MQTLLIGLGNSLLTDDGAGPATLALLRPQLRGLKNVTCKELSVGGLALMEAMVGFQRVFLVDAMVTGNLEIGSVRSVPVGTLSPSKNLTCTHDVGLAAALEIGRALELTLPDDIRIWGIEAQDVETFRIGLSDPVARATGEVAREILSMLQEEAL